eukprot:Hpha_TRINITY_DN27822_c0_g1::TRINITY_DN27822_c0_g1_i1::g.193995::m.193995
MLQAAAGGAEQPLVVPSVPRPQEECLQTLTVGQEEVLLVEEGYFGPLRQWLGVPDDFLKDNVDFKKVAPGGGKGGDSMCLSLCGRWLVKELGVNDSVTLCDESFLSAYTRYLMQEGTQSLLARIVCVFMRKVDSQYFHVMNNWLPQNLRWSKLLDLKGNRDDKLLVSDGEPVAQIHKRFWMMSWLLGESAPCLSSCFPVPVDRQIYADGKKQAFDCPFHVTPASRSAIIGQLQRDTNFLASRNLMDYSLIAGMLRISADASAPKPGRGDVYANPLCGGRGTSAWWHYLGIIDFLQSYNCRKKLAHVVKVIFAPKPISTVNPNEYAHQFVKSFERRFVADQTELPPPKPVSRSPLQSPELTANGFVPRRADAVRDSGASTATSVKRKVCPLKGSVTLSPCRGPLNITVVDGRSGERQVFSTGPYEDPAALEAAVRGAFGVREEDELCLTDPAGSRVPTAKLPHQGPGEYWTLKS